MYQPFPSVSQWDELAVSLRDVDIAHERMQHAKETVSPEALASALQTARRAAAVDTNAIEGIFRLTVASRAQWQSKLVRGSN